MKTNHVVGAVLIAMISLACVARFWHLDESPPGFYVDESAGAMNILCVRQEGIDFFGKPRSLFPNNLLGGVSSPTYIYFGVLWSTIFGDSIASLRAIPALFSVLAIVGLFFLGRIFMGNLGGALAAFALALSPWDFQFARIAWDSPLQNAFLIWGLYFLFKPYRLGNAAAAGGLFALAMYTYLAARLSTPLLVGALLVIPATRRRLNLRGYLVMAGVATLTCVPLIQLIFSEAGRARFQQVSILAPGYFAGVAQGSYLRWLSLFLENFFTLFGFNFLFVSGDRNLRHSTGAFGELGWVDIFALLCGVGLLAYCGWSYARKSGALAEVPARTRALVWLCFLGILAGAMPAALSWESNPHALRAIGALPFVSLLSGWLLYEAVRRWNLVIIPLGLVAVVYSVIFCRFYFTEYPRRADAWFDTEIGAPRTSPVKRTIGGPFLVVIALISRSGCATI